MMRTCNVCGGAIFPPGISYSYSGPVCPGNHNPTYVWPYVSPPAQIYDAALHAKLDKIIELLEATNKHSEAKE